MLILQITTDDGSAWEQRILDDEFVIGRSPRAGMSIPDRSLSRLHARLFHSGESWFVEDLGSRNGTFVNQVRVEGSSLVDFGDALTLGSSRVVMVDPGATTPPDTNEIELSSGHTVFRSAVDLLESGTVSTVPPGEEKAAQGAAVERLRLLNEVHHALGRSVEQQELLELILDRVFDLLQPEEGAIFLRQGESGYLRAAARATGKDAHGLVSQSLFREVVEKRQAALVLDARSDERFNQAQSLVLSGLRSILAAPLLDGDRALGMIVLGSSHGIRAFGEDDMELLVTLASVAAMRISNIRLAEEAAERRRLEQEVALGRRIQMALIPDELPQIEGWELHAENLPSRGVSGDIYSIFRREDGETLVVLVADVSGKGIAAALLTASLEALAAGPLDAGMPLDDTCRQVSRLLYARTPSERYATAFIAEINLSTGMVSYVNGGHNPGLVLRLGGEAELLEIGGVPLGLLPGVAYQTGTVELRPRDVLMIYTDGLTEAANQNENDYGEDRLRRVSLKHRLEPLDEFADAVERDLEDFVEGVPFSDDRTLVLVRRSCNRDAGRGGV